MHEGGSVGTTAFKLTPEWKGMLNRVVYREFSIHFILKELGCPKIKGWNMTVKYSEVRV